MVLALGDCEKGAAMAFERIVSLSGFARFLFFFEVFSTFT
jgi:hypothetical protein